MVVSVVISEDETSDDAASHVNNVHWNTVVHVIYRMFLGHATFMLLVLFLSSVMYWWQFPYIPSVVIVSVFSPLAVAILVFLAWKKESLFFAVLFYASLSLLCGGIACLSQSAGVLFFLLSIISQCVGVLAVCFIYHNTRDLRLIYLFLGMVCGSLVSINAGLLPYCIRGVNSFVSLFVVSILSAFTIAYHVLQARNAKTRGYSLDDSLLSIVRIYTDLVEWVTF